MALDGITLRAITKELNEKLIGGRVQKIYQINKHLIVFNIYNKENYKVLISSNPQNSRIHITNEDYKNPTNPPQFAMILRKYLNNSIIKEIRQLSLDRSLEIVFGGKDELGFDEDIKIIVDIMGKHSNIILVNKNNKVIEAIKRISHEMSSVRAIYPGTTFQFLENLKIDILIENIDLYDKKIDKNLSLKKLFYTTFVGFGPQIGLEVCFRANLEYNRTLSSLSKEEYERINLEFLKIVNDIKINKYTPTIYTEKENISDFYSFILTNKGNSFEKLNSISEALDIYYSKNVNDNTINQAKNNLDKHLDNLIQKNSVKINNLSLDYEESLNYEKYRIEGDLLSAVAHNLNKKQDKVDVQNYYDNNNLITIILDPKKSIWQNIDNKYKISKKLHKRLNILKNTIPNIQDEIIYLSNIKLQLNYIDNLEELREINDELEKEGYLKNKSKKSKNNKHSEKSQALRFLTKNGNIIYVGKNNKQNEYITLREANQNDYFFHIKNLPGAHVILKNNKKITDDDINIAAYLAAIYSKNSNDRYIDIDYTEKKNVNKSKGSKPGMVYYTNFKTIRVDVDLKPLGFEKM